MISVLSELAEYTRAVFWGFLFLSAVLRPSFLKLKPIEYENRYGHARTGRIDCVGLAVAIDKTAENQPTCGPREHLIWPDPKFRYPSQSTISCQDEGA